MEDNKLVPDADKRRPPNAGKGRPKGVPNKSTAAVKAALQAAYDDLQAEAAGGDPDAGENAHLKAWALANPTEFYKLWVKMLPTELSGPNGGAIPVRDLTDRLAGLTPEQREGLRASIREAIQGTAQ